MTLKMEQMLAAYNVISQAKFEKLADADKIKVWKISRALKPFVYKFNEDSEDAAKTFKPCDDWDDKAIKADEFERMTKAVNFDAQKLPIGPAEYSEIKRLYNKYQKDLAEALKEASEKEHEVEFEQISQDAMLKLSASNPQWTFGHLTAIDIIVKVEQ